MRKSATFLLDLTFSYCAEFNFWLLFGMAKKQKTPISGNTPQQEATPPNTLPEHAELPLDTESEIGEFSPAIDSPRGIFARGQVVNKGVLEAIRRAGGTQQALAEGMGVSNVTIHKWIYESLPAERAVEIEKLYGVSRRILRPDLFNVDEYVYSKPVRIVEANNNRYVEADTDTQGED